MPKTTDDIKIRKSRERGHANHGWLDSYFTFSFADYQDEKFMGYRTLRVINEDRVEPGQGFGMHPHRDMEIITYVVEGELAHKDSMGNGSTIKAGCLQRMTAGTGVTHSEFNSSQVKKLHLLQIWILPEQRGLKPSYEELNLQDARRENSLTLVASNDATKNVLKVHQDVRLYSGLLGPEVQVNYTLEDDRGVWIQMIKGSIDINGIKLAPGDGVAIEREPNLTIQAQERAEFLLFDLK